MNKLIDYFRKPELLDRNNVYVIFTTIHTVLVGFTALIFMASGSYTEAAVIGIGVMLYFFCVYLALNTPYMFAAKLISMLTLYLAIAYFYLVLDYGPISFLSILMAMTPIYSVLVTQKRYHKRLVTMAVVFAVLMYAAWSFIHFGVHIDSLWEDQRALLVSLFVIMLGGSLGIHISYYIRLVEDQREQIRNAKKNLGSFISAVSHQLKTPLNGIMGIQDLLESSEIETDKTELYQILKHSSLSMMRDMNNIMEISKLDGDMIAVHEEDFALDEIFEDIIFVYRENLFNMRQNIHYESSNLNFRGDKYKIRLMLENVFDTIIDFNAESQIDAQAKYEDQQLQIEIVDRTDDKEKRSKIADLDFANFAIHDFRESNTLGLYITNILAEYLKGNFSVRVEKEGVKYKMLLPMQQIQAIPTDKEARSAKKIKHILLVEDNAISRKVISSHFRKKNYDITSSINGLEALEYVKNNYQNIDLIFMDIQMPVMDGITATRKIRDWEYQNTQSTKPIIALTANTMYEDKLLCYSSGMNYFISKPFNPPKMELLIKKIENNKSF